MLDGSIVSQFDGIYSLDVLEHIQPSDEDRFIKNTLNSLKLNGSLIIGMPSIESQKYASAPSKAAMLIVSPLKTSKIDESIFIMYSFFQ